jgi:hypothetical protein
VNDEGLLGPALVAAGILLLGMAWFTVSSRTPSNAREWAEDHALPARIDIEEGRIRIRNLRTFRHETPQVSQPGWDDVTVELDEVVDVWLVIAPFPDVAEGLAHTFVSFELEGGRFIAVSVEARREEGEPYSIWRGLVRGFELTYVVGSEADLLGVRAVRGDPLYLYPTRATPEQARALFVDMLRAAERVRTEPVFYHTLWRNCATRLRAHVNRVIAAPLPVGWATVFPGNADRLAFRRGLLDLRVPPPEARELHRVDEAVRRALEEGGDISARIRQGLPRPRSEP